MTKVEELTTRFGMVVTGARGKHRGDGGDYVYACSGKLVRLAKRLLTAFSRFPGDFNHA